MARVLVTGGAGFIGSHLVTSLLQAGHDVCVFDDLSYGRRESVAAGAAGRSCEFIQGDVRSRKELLAAIDIPPDIVYHLAGLHFIPFCEANPAQALDVNVQGLHTLLEALAPTPPQSFVFASSGAVYGFSEAPADERARIQLHDVYSLTKWLGEKLVERFQSEHSDARAVVARLFNTYGPGETNPHLIPHIMEALQRGETISLGNLWPRRDLIYVTDTVAGLRSLAEGPPGFDTVNVGTGSGHSVEEVVHVLSDLLGRRLEVEQDQALRRKDEGHLVADSAKLQAMGWRPEHDLEAGLRRLLNHEALL